MSYRCRKHFTYYEPFFGCPVCYEERKAEARKKYADKGLLHPTNKDLLKCEKCGRFKIMYWNFSKLSDGTYKTKCNACLKREEKATQFLDKLKIERKIEKLIKQLDGKPSNTQKPPIPDT